MTQRELLDFLHAAEKLKYTPRHSYSSAGRRESVAEHSWRLSLFALLLEGEFPELDTAKVLRMCIIHDLGEAVTGDIPSFYKTEQDEKRETELLDGLLKTLPEREYGGLRALFDEMDALKTPEARLYKTLDKLEAVLSHNEAPLSTWIPVEYSENLVYGTENAAAFPWLAELRRLLKEDSENKVRAAAQNAETSGASAVPRVKQRTLYGAGRDRAERAKAAYLPFSTPELSGMTGLIQFERVRSPFVRELSGKKLLLADDGFFWLSVAPEKKSWWLTVALDPSGEAVQYYFDVTAGNASVGDNPCFTDMFLDVVMTPDGSAELLDTEELDAALAAETITAEQADAARKTAEKLLRELPENAGKLRSFVKDAYARLLPLLTPCV